MSLPDPRISAPNYRVHLELDEGRFFARVEGAEEMDDAEFAFYLLHNGHKVEVRPYSVQRSVGFGTPVGEGRFRARAFLRSPSGQGTISVMSPAVTRDGAEQKRIVPEVVSRAAELRGSAPSTTQTPPVAAPILPTPRNGPLRATTSMTLLETIQAIKPRQDFLNHTYISLRHRYLYAAVGKAANSTVKHHLYELEYAGTRFKTKSLHDRQSSPLLSPFQLPDDLLAQVLTGPDYLRFTVVRNPFTRLLSCYLDRIVPADSMPYRQLLNVIGGAPGEAISFDTFLRAVCRQRPFEQNNHWRLQVSEVCSDAIRYDIVGKQESFAEDMKRIWGRVAPGRPMPDFAAENKAPSITSAEQRIAEFYTPALIDLVRSAYRADFETFGYSLDPQ